MSLKLSISFLLASVLLTASNCVLERNFEPEVEVRPGIGKFNHEILLRGQFRGRGNPHDPFDWSEKKWIQLYWIYTPVLSGRLNAADVVLTRDRGCVGESERHYRDLEGFIEFQQDTVTVALEVAQYDRNTTVLTGHKPFEGNGTYKMANRLKEEFMPRNEQEDAHVKNGNCKNP